MKISDYKLTGLLAFLLSVLSLAVPVAANAQTPQITVSGKITDSSGEPLAGVSVMIPGTMIGVGSGLEGDYSITVDLGSTLRFSCIGFESKDIKATKTHFEVVLEEETMMMDQVVVTGYSQVELRKSTGAVAVIGADVIDFVAAPFTFDYSRCFQPHQVLGNHGLTLPSPLLHAPHIPAAAVPARAIRPHLPGPFASGSSGCTFQKTWGRRICSVSLFVPPM